MLLLPLSRWPLLILVSFRAPIVGFQDPPLLTAWCLMEYSLFIPLRQRYRVLINTEMKTQKETQFEAQVDTIYSEVDEQVDAEIDNQIYA